MIQLYDSGAYLIDGSQIIPDNEDSMAKVAEATGQQVSSEEAAKNTIAYSILKAHNTTDNMDKLKIKFDKLTSHDITFVGIIQTV